MRQRNVNIKPSAQADQAQDKEGRPGKQVKYLPKTSYYLLPFITSYLILPPPTSCPPRQLYPGELEHQGHFLLPYSPSLAPGRPASCSVCGLPALPLLQVTPTPAAPTPATTPPTPVSVPVPHLPPLPAPLLPASLGQELCGGVAGLSAWRTGGCSYYYYH